MKPIVKIALSAVAIFAFAWLAFGFFGIQALFTNREVNEEIPDVLAQTLSDSNNETPLLGQGAFTQGDSTYTIAGNAFLSQVDSDFNLTLTDFEVSNGPDLYVYAVKSNSTDNATVKQAVADGSFVSLGTLKGNIGNQSYTLNSEFDPDEYPVVAIWCQRFSRNFGSARLDASQP